MAQTIIPDTTLGSEQSQVVRDVEIRGNRATRIGGGAIRGRNLFHSFQTFNIEAGQRVYFANPGKIRNILSRVTGRSRSNIDGTLGVVGTANLFLLNPNGIIFGPDAELDLRGSFFATTADRFSFADGSHFSATNFQTPPLLTVSIPTGIQFGAVPGEIQVRSRNDAHSETRLNSFDFPAGGLQVADHTLALIGGIVTLEGGALSVEEGRIELGSITNSGFAKFEQVEAGNWDVRYGGTRQPVRNFQTIRLSEAGVLSGTQGSVIQLRSRDLRLTDRSQIVASISGREEQVNRETSAIPENVIRLAVAETLALEQGARIATLATNNSRAGNLAIDSRLIDLRDGSRIETVADSNSSPGNINIQAQNLNISGRSTEGVSSGIFARVEEIPIADEPPEQDPDDPVDNGDEPPEQEPDDLADNEFGDDESNSFDEKSVLLRISLRDSIGGFSDNSSNSIVNQTAAETESGDGGYLTIAVVRTLRLSNGAEIAILAPDSRMGDINLIGGNNLAIGNLRADQSRVSTQVGRGGAITIEAERVNLQQSQISTEQRLTVDDADKVDDDTTSLGAANLQLRIRQRLILREDSKISTQSAAEGANLRIRSPQLWVNQSRLVTQGGTERGANATVRARSIRLTDSDLNLTAGTGGGGNLQLRGLDSALLLNAVSSRLTTQSAVEPGANLTIAAQEINLNASTFTTVSGAAGGANMRLRGSTPPMPLRPSDLILFLENRSQLQTRSAIQGGNILINARRIEAPPSSDSDIIASLPVQQGGRIALDLLNEETDLIGFRQGAAIPGNGTNDIDSGAGVAIRELPVIDLPEVELPSDALNASEVIAQGCKLLPNTVDSQDRLSVTGRSGLPSTPYEPISGGETLSDLRLPTEMATPMPLIEAQRWQVEPGGTIILVAEPQSQPCEDS